MFRVQAPYPAATDTLVIRSAQFSNQRNKTHDLTLVRTGNGDLYTYIRKKRGREAHQWEFLVSYEKLIEVKEFIRVYASTLVRVYDHNDVEYIGYLTVNPWEGGGEGRAGGWPGNEAYGFTLQIEQKV